MRLPKEAVAYLLQQAERTRREVTRLVGRELRSVLSHVDWAREARRLVHGTRLQVRAEVRLVAAEPRSKRRAPGARAAPATARAAARRPSGEES